MQRQFSVDDFNNLGNFWKLGASMAGFPRTDSEAAFQDFLKRIPSTSNLAAQAQGLDQAQQLHLQQQVQQFQQAQQAGLHAAGSALPGGALGEVGGLNVGGIPRVPSLDLLRQLVQVNQTLSPQSQKGATSVPGEGVSSNSLLSARCVFSRTLFPDTLTCLCRGGHQAHGAGAGAYCELKCCHAPPLDECATVERPAPDIFERQSRGSCFATRQLPWDSAADEEWWQHQRLPFRQGDQWQGGAQTCKEVGFFLRSRDAVL